MSESSVEFSGASRWWGEFHFPEPGQRYMQLGPLRLWLSRKHDEWRVFTLRGNDPFASEMSLLQEVEAQEIPEEAKGRRFAFGASPERIRIAPKMPDRSMVVRPDALLSISPGATVELYVSYPVWLELIFGHPPAAQDHFPVFQSTESWFGRNTTDGELCYASLSPLCGQSSDLVLPPHRIVTKLRVNNRSTTSLDIERIKIPVRHLSIFADANGCLWTETVSLIRNETNDLASLRVLDGPPEQAKGAHALSPASVRPDANLVERAFQALFSK